MSIQKMLLRLTGLMSRKRIAEEKGKFCGFLHGILAATFGIRPIKTAVFVAVAQLITACPWIPIHNLFPSIL